MRFCPTNGAKCDRIHQDAYRHAADFCLHALPRRTERRPVQPFPAGRKERTVLPLQAGRGSADPLVLPLQAGRGSADPQRVRFRFFVPAKALAESGANAPTARPGFRPASAGAGLSVAVFGGFLVRHDGRRADSPIYCDKKGEIFRIRLDFFYKMCYNILK